jgi:hypothetical protein
MGPGQGRDKERIIRKLLSGNHGKDLVISFGKLYHRAGTVRVLSKDIPERNKRMSRRKTKRYPGKKTGDARRWRKIQRKH